MMAPGGWRLLVGSPPNRWNDSRELLREVATRNIRRREMKIKKFHSGGVQNLFIFVKYS